MPILPGTIPIQKLRNSETTIQKLSFRNCWQLGFRNRDFETMIWKLLSEIRLSNSTSVQPESGVGSGGNDALGTSIFVVV